MRSFDTAPVEVRLEACYCPGSPHEADLVYLAPELSMSAGMLATQILSDYVSDRDQAALQAGLAEVWQRSVVSWNLVDETGPVPVTFENVRDALPFGKGGRLVAMAADSLYSEAVLSPLGVGSKSSSRRSRTNGSTSATQPSSRKRRSPSSTATTAKAPAAG